MSKSSYKRLIIEGLMIVFSVLFALFINRTAEKASINKQKRVALERIEQELQNNARILDAWQERHNLIKERVQKIMNNPADTLRQQLQSFPFFNFGLLTNNESIANEMPSNTSWETAKSTQIISEFDYQLAEKLTNAYSLQEIILEKSLFRLTDVYFSRESQDMSQLDATLLQFYMTFTELTGQEYLLDTFYEEALTYMEALKK